MLISMYYEMPNGKVWGVGYGLFLSKPDDVDPANIVIPINQMACNSRKSDKIPEEVAGVATGKSGRHSQE